MANTRETLGEQATLDGFINKSLTSFIEDGITSVVSNAFYNQSQLTMLDFPSVNVISMGAFTGCTNLKDLILRKSSMVTLNSTDAFTGTKIMVGDGAIYVPSDLLSTYRGNAKWSNFCILPILSYPASVYETVTETWAQIEANGASNCVLGDRKVVSINGADYIAVLIGKNKDALKAGGTANSTWLLLNAFETQKMNSSNITAGGYESSALRSHIINDILPNFELKDLIKEVVKISDTYENGAIVHNGQSTDEKLWIPSAYEIFGGTSYETQGCTYLDWFNSSAKKTKYYNGSACTWWLRSAYSGSGFRYVGGGGNASYGNASGAVGVVLGFCL